MNEKKKSLPLYLRILIGMFMGIIWGVSAPEISGGTSFSLQYIKPLGAVFINLLKMIAVPIILSSLITGIASLKDLNTLGKIGGRTILLFLCTAIIATSLGIAIANLFDPGKQISPEIRTQLVEKYGAEAEKKVENALSIQESGPLAFLIDAILKILPKPLLIIRTCFRLYFLHCL